VARHPTVVLVHGAFADGATWAPVARALLDADCPVLVPAVPNRSLSGDAASLRFLLERIDGPVLLVGHSYGGAVITVAGVAENVVGLVYVAGYALEEGESIGRLQGRFPVSDLAANLVYTSPSTEDGEAADVSVRISAFPELLAEGIPVAVAEVLAVSQRPLAAAVLGEPAAAAAWRTRPGWGVVAARDRALDPDVQRFGYERAGLLAVTEIDAPHLAPMTHAGEIVAVVRTALAALSARGEDIRR
jgi:pimeloyl-ACP methyl ester carboxylesterase